MGNVVEITIVAKNDTGPGIAKAKADVEDLGNSSKKSNESMSLLSGTLGLFGSALLPMGMAAAAAGAALAGAGVAAGAFGAAIIPQITDVKAASDANDKYKAAVNQFGASSTQAKTALQAYNAQIANMPPASIAAANALMNLKDQFKSWSDSLANSTMPVFTKGLGIVSQMLPYLTPLVKSAADQFTRLEDHISAGINTQQFGDLAARFQGFADNALKRVVDGIITLSEKIGHLLVSDSFKSFMDQAMALGPGVAEAFKNIAEFVGRFIQASSGFAGVDLKIFEVIANTLGSIPTGVLEVVAPIIMGIVAATKLWGIATWAVTAAEAAATTATEVLDTAMMALPFVAVAAGVVALIAKFGSFTGVTDHTTVSLTTLQNAFLDINDGSAVATKNIGDMAAAFMFMSQKLNDNKPVQGLKDMDSALASMVSSGHAQQAQAAVADITTSLQAQGVSLGYIHDQVLPKYNQAVADAALKNREAKSATDGLTQAQQQAKDAQQALTTAVDSATAQYDAAKKAAQGYQDVLDALFGKFGSLSDAQAKFTLAMSNATGKITAGKDAINLLTVAGAKNFQEFENLSKANMDVASNMIRTGSSADDATTALRNGASAIDALASKSGFTASQIAALNTKLYGVPNVKDIQINANVSTAISNIQAVANTVASLESATLSVALKGTRMRAAFAHGGEVGTAASGGERNGFTLVGEEGPELVRLPVGSTVRSNPDTMASIGGHGGGGGVVQLEWIGNNGGDDFMRWIRKNIRAQYGNNPNSVQLALGQKF